MSEPSIANHLNLRAGEWVQIRSKEEILSTLDEKGQLQQMPFMPEMFQFCGKRFQVSKRAHKTCDPVNGLHGRRLPSTVHLEGLRCDGSAHGGCQAGCLIFWKEAWLKRAADDARVSDLASSSLRPGGHGCSEADVLDATTVRHQQTNVDDVTYVCQATKVADATSPIAWWNPWQYVEDVSSGNVQLSQLGAALFFYIYSTIAEAGMGLGSAMRWVYERFQQARNGTPYPIRRGKVPPGSRTPTLKLGLQAGELVKIKDYRQILETLDQNARNRGLYCDPEIVPFCNRTYRVLRRVEQIIDEKTGVMLRLKNDALILDGLVCQARYAKYRRLCPRGYYQYMREIWLERVDPGTSEQHLATEVKTGIASTPEA
jgi:hypothetical protein